MSNLTDQQVWDRAKAVLGEPKKGQKQYVQLTDTSNAEFINRLFGDKVRFDHKRKRWLVWTDHRWQPDNNNSINRLAIEATRIRYHEASSVSDLDLRSKTAKWAIGSESRTRLDAAVGIAKSLLPIADSGDDWDSNLMLLACPNGILDLKTGDFRNGLPEDRITMSANTKFDPAAACPRWIEFLNEVFESNESLILYIKKILGYSITGSTEEQAVFIGFGPGSNGKSVFFSTIRSILGDYAINAPASLFQRNTMSTQSNDLASTEFKRFLMCSEVLSTARINEQRIKQISGGDPITARYLYSEHFTFMPTAKIWLFVNHRPVVEDDSYGFWRRVRLIPFSRVFSPEEQDKQLVNKLLAEAPGILNWLLEGCLEWQREGLNPTPQIITTATKEYQTENDDLAEFLFDFVATNPEDQVQSLEIYKSYQTWCEEHGLKGKDILSNNAFGRRMGDKFNKKFSNGRAFYTGLSHLVADSYAQVADLTPFSIKSPIQNTLAKVYINDHKSATQAQKSTTDPLQEDLSNSTSLEPEKVKIPPELEGLI